MRYRCLFSSKSKEAKLRIAIAGNQGLVYGGDSPREPLIKLLIRQDITLSVSVGSADDCADTTKIITV